jgi:hypothetical protein
MICEKCGKEMEVGYGLAGGGIGPYFYCTTEGCDGFKKFQDPEMDVGKLPEKFLGKNFFEC